MSPITSKSQNHHVLSSLIENGARRSVLRGVIVRSRVLVGSNSALPDFYQSLKNSWAGLQSYDKVLCVFIETPYSKSYVIFIAIYTVVLGTMKIR